MDGNMARIVIERRGWSRLAAVLSVLGLFGLVLGAVGLLIWSGQEQPYRLPSGLDKMARLPDAPSIPEDPLELAFGTDRPDWNLADFNVEGTANNTSTYENVTKEEARKFNKALPFADARGATAAPYFLRANSDLDRSRAIHCLSLAVYYEAASETMRGQHAVAQVVLNRVRHPAWPHTVCGVVFQGSERSTGCQFTFTCDGALGRPPANKTWMRAQSVAYAALSGYVSADVGLATHYHTDWVAPRWAPSLRKLTQIGTHIFYTWKGKGGTSIAFRIRSNGTEAWPRKASRTAPELGLPDPLVELATTGGVLASPGTAIDPLTGLATPNTKLALQGATGAMAGRRPSSQTEDGVASLLAQSASRSGGASAASASRYELPKLGDDGLMPEPDLASLKPKIEIPELVMPSSTQLGKASGTPSPMVREQTKSRALD